MNAFVTVLEQHNGQTCLRRAQLMTLQVNMGNLCNQSCTHCHIDASPHGKNIMSKKVVDDILAFLSHYTIKTLDITGGAPELNPHFEYFIKNARATVEELIVRSNLTVLFEPRKEHLPQLFKDNRVHLICSLPCYTQEAVDAQRGGGVFEKSITALQLLNELGYTRSQDHKLDLVYNPAGAALPPLQPGLEEQYKQQLKSRYNVSFNRLVTITNVPIKRFKHYLQSRGEYEQYYNLLKENFNPEVLDKLMCRTFLSVGYDGKLYDCDFNQALGLCLKDESGRELAIDKLNPYELQGKEIIIGTHCLSCTAGCGSSCQGRLSSAKDEQPALHEACNVEEVHVPAANELERFPFSGDSQEMSTLNSVKEYYGTLLQSTKDLKTNACCSSDSLNIEHKKILADIEPEIISRFYGCGSPIPPEISGCTVLDLGCGTGRDAYIASALVGERGTVIGIDMTDEQLEVAIRHRQVQMQRFGFLGCNVDFRKGYIEDLRSAGIDDNSVDVVISNCVINLSPDKKRVFAEIYRVLKPGGELYFADVFAGCRVPGDIKNDPLFYGECLGGALYIEDFRRILSEVGFSDYRMTARQRIRLNNPDMQAKAGMIDFYSMTVRVFKLDSLEDRCEDYGQTATYQGTMNGFAHSFAFDAEHIFFTGKPALVCGNTASMLSETRYGRYFQVNGDRSKHFGLFNAAPVVDAIDKENHPRKGCC